MERPNPYPTGTIAFLFTDLEGSTRLWQDHSDAMSAAVARHDHLLRNAIELRGGYVFKTVGDAFCAAFDTPAAALAAALAAQRALAAEPWDATGLLRARMAVHAGQAEEREGDYFGSAVNRVARLLAAGHGGQTLLSRAAQELLLDGLPPDVRLRDLGAHRLKDLDRPEHVFQVVVPDLPVDFPPLVSRDRRQINLPVQLTPFVGREREVADLVGRLAQPEVRLLTLTGPGGIGKTRLALRAASEGIDTFADGVFVVELAPIVDPDLVTQSIADVLGLRETPGQPLIEVLSEFLREKKLLLILDNFEHVEDAAPLVATLLRSCPRLTVLATSRHALRVTGEREVAVPPLALPDLDGDASPDQLAEFESVRLFVERAQAVDARFALTADNAAAVAEICRRLDGLPLAIELAAARCKLLAPQAILARLEKRLALLTGGARDRPERQQTLRGAIDWSCDLLSPEEQALFARLAVFAGGCTFDAAEAVCTGVDGPSVDALDGLANLVDKSLLRREDPSAGEMCFSMLQTIHEYARDRLTERGEADAMRERHAAHFLALAEEAEPYLSGGARQREWLDRLEPEHDNLRAALAWAEERGEAETALRLAGAVNWFWYVRGHLAEGLRWLERALALAGEPVTAIRAKALDAAGSFAETQGDYRRAAEFLGEALAISQQLGDSRETARSLNHLGHVDSAVGDYDRAVARYEEALVAARKVGDQRIIATALIGLGVVAIKRAEYAWAAEVYREALGLLRAVDDRRGASIALSNLGVVVHALGDAAQAEAHYEESLALERELGDPYGVALSLINVAVMALERGEPERARAMCEEALPILEDAGDRRGIAYVLNNLGSAARDLGEPDRAAELFGQSLALHGELGDRGGITDCLEDLAATASEPRHAEQVARLIGAADALREAIGEPRNPHRQPRHELAATWAAAHLSEQAYVAAYDAGRALPHEMAVADAISLVDALGSFNPESPPSVASGTAGQPSR